MSMLLSIPMLNFSFWSHKVYRKALGLGKLNKKKKIVIGLCKVVREMSRKEKNGHHMGQEKETLPRKPTHCTLKCSHVTK